MEEATLTYIILCIISGMEIWLVLEVGLRFVARMDSLWQFSWTRRSRAGFLMAALAGGSLVIHCCSFWGRQTNWNLPVKMTMSCLLCMVMGLLLLACVTDLQGHYVYQITWWIASPICGVLLWMGRMPLKDEFRVWLVPVILFGCIQELVFAKMYGRADCHAFVVCSLLEASMGMGLWWYTIHMAIVFGMLTIVQGMCGNIDRRGRLRVPQPLLPYITGGLWVTMLIYVGAHGEELERLQTIVDFFIKR